MHYLTRSRERRGSATGLAGSTVSRGLWPQLRYGLSVFYRGDRPKPRLDRALCSGADYHQVMQGRLAQLQAFVATLVPPTVVSNRTDTGPVVERVYANMRAWVGSAKIPACRIPGSAPGCCWGTHPDHPRSMTVRGSTIAGRAPAAWRLVQRRRFWSPTFWMRSVALRI